MGDLTRLEILIGFCSIGGFLIAVGILINKWVRIYRRKKQSAEEELEERFAWLEASGGTVSGRSDLSFFVLIELGSLRGLVSSFRFYAITFLLFANIILGLVIFGGKMVDDMIGLVGSKIVLGIGSASILLGLLSFGFSNRLEKYIQSYQVRIRGILARPIEKRSSASVDGTAI